MTDRTEPPFERPTFEEDATTRIAAQPRDRSALPSPAQTPTDANAPIESRATAPTAPLTPASRASAPPPAFEHERPAFENELPWAATSPATRVLPPRPPRRGGRVRWAISLVVIALVIGSTAAIAALITGQSSVSTVMGYVPDDAVMYGEVRLDLPGDQRRAVGEFLTRFPGFADQAALDSKLDEVLDDLIKDATKDQQTYTANIKPWFDGQLAVSVGTPPSPTTLDGPSPGASARGLVLMSIKDATGAKAWFDAALAKSGAKTTTESYGTATLTVFGETAGFKAAVTFLDDKVAVAGDIVSVKAAIDSKGASGFAAKAGPKTAIDSGDGDHVGFVYVATGALLDWSTELNKEMARITGAPATPIGPALRKAIPAWGAYWLRVERDAIVMESVAPTTETAMGPTENRASTLAEHIPSTAVVASTSNDFGKTLKDGLDLYRSEPSLKSTVDQIDQALGLVGGADAAIGWAGDTAMVVTVSNGTPEFGLVVAPTDRANAERLFTSLRSFISIGGAQQGISLHDEPYAGTTITVVDLGDLQRLTGAGAMTRGLSLPTGHIEIAYAVTGEVVVLGSSPSFVKHVLDTTKETSLASNERYRTLADRAGTGTGTSFVDVTAIRALIEKAVADSPASSGIAKYEKDVKPFLTPFDAIVASGSLDGDLQRSVIYVTVK